MSRAEVVLIPTEIAHDWVNNRYSESRSIYEHYESELLIKLQLSTGTVRVVYDLHYSGEFHECVECSRVADDEIMWPCLTARSLGEIIGVSVPDRVTYDD